MEPLALVEGEAADEDLEIALEVDRLGRESDGHSTRTADVADSTARLIGSIGSAGAPTGRR